MNILSKNHGLIAAVIFIVVFSITAYLTREISQTEYNYCIQVATDIYEQRDEFLIEIPSNVGFSKTDTEITVRLKGIRLGRIVAFVDNGKLVSKIDSQKALSCCFSILFGFLAGLIYCLLIICSIEKRCRRF